MMDMFPGYILDVEYRTDRREEAFKALVEMVIRRFAVAERLYQPPQQHLEARPQDALTPQDNTT